ncbi:DgyrCDS5313 [Dimorphilus gyrociliatus]|uniref:DgyrCDS5313 n=1 Tax=Dimorphilus gyrociliatus TaxID=2664684 RepID=A0A7I8VLV5_9ANNE|nr:DgyrCDS5313 [Dimorphilus gyrociliatus]
MDSKVLEEIEQKAKMKINKQHLRKLVTDHLTMACKSALPDERMFTVEALVGITLSSKEVMLINVKENVSNQLTKNVAKDKRNMSSSVDDVSEALKRKFEHEPAKTSSKRKSDKIKSERSGSPVVKRSRVSLPPQHRIRNSYDPPELDALRKLATPNEALTGWYSQVLPQSLVLPPFLNGSFQNAARPSLQHPMFTSRQYPGLSEDDSSPRNQSPQPDDDKSAEALDMTKPDDYEETDVNMNKTTPLKLLAQTVIEQVIFLSMTPPYRPFTEKIAVWRTTRSNGGEEIKRSSSCEPIVNKQVCSSAFAEAIIALDANFCSKQ